MVPSLFIYFYPIKHIWHMTYDDFSNIWKREIIPRLKKEKKEGVLVGCLLLLSSIFILYRFFYLNLSGVLVQIWSFSRSITIGRCVSLVFGCNLWLLNLLLYIKKTKNSNSDLAGNLFFSAFFIQNNNILKLDVPEGTRVINILIFIAFASWCRKSIRFQQRNLHQVPSSAQGWERFFKRKTNTSP